MPSINEMTNKLHWEDNNVVERPFQHLDDEIPVAQNTIAEQTRDRIADGCRQLQRAWQKGVDFYNDLVYARRFIFDCALDLIQNAARNGRLVNPL